MRLRGSKILASSTCTLKSVLILLHNLMCTYNPVDKIMSFSKPQSNLVFSFLIWWLKCQIFNFAPISQTQSFSNTASYSFHSILTIPPPRLKLHVTAFVHVYWQSDDQMWNLNSYFGRWTLPELIILQDASFLTYSIIPYKFH